MEKRPKCPECPHHLDEHDQWIGCRVQKRGASGKLVVCPCNRAVKKENVDVRP